MCTHTERDRSRLLSHTLYNNNHPHHNFFAFRVEFLHYIHEEIFRQLFLSLSSFFVHSLVFFLFLQFLNDALHHSPRCPARPDHILVRHWQQVSSFPLEASVRLFDQCFHMLCKKTRQKQMTHGKIRREHRTTRQWTRRVWQTRWSHYNQFIILIGFITTYRTRSG